MTDTMLPVELGVRRPGEELGLLEQDIVDPNRDSWFFDRVRSEPAFGIFWLHQLADVEEGLRVGAFRELTTADFGPGIDKGAILHKCGDCDHSDAMQAAVKELVGNNRLFDCSWLVGGVTTWPLSIFNQKVDTSPAWRMSIDVAMEEKGVTSLLSLPHVPCIGVYKVMASVWTLALETLRMQEYELEQHPNLTVVPALHTFDSKARILLYIDRTKTVELLKRKFGERIESILPRSTLTV